MIKNNHDHIVCKIKKGRIKVQITLLSLLFIIIETYIM